MSQQQERALISAFDAVVCDLDGVVYRGGDAIDGAAAALNALRRSGVRVAYATNNASRPPAVVAEQLQRLGVELEVRDVVTSAQAGARAMLDEVGPGSVILAVGGPGVRAALAAVGLDAVSGPAPDARRIDGVLQGFGAQVAWADLAEAAYAIQGGATWIATNADTTLPTERGTAPGNGTLVHAVRQAVDRDPVVVGKPQTPLYELAAGLLHSEVARTLAVGDRLNTDVAGATAAGMSCLLVLTGVDGATELASAPEAQRPRYVVSSLAALQLPYAEARLRDAASASCGTAVVTLGHHGSQQRLRSVGAGTPQERLRAALALLWREVDQRRLSPEDAARLVSALG